MVDSGSNPDSDSGSDPIPVRDSASGSDSFPAPESTRLSNPAIRATFRPFPAPIPHSHPLRADFAPFSAQTRGFCAFRARIGPFHYAGVNGRVKDVVRANDVGLDGLHREKLAARDLLEGGGVEDVVHAAHRALERGLVAHVADIELDLAGCLRIIGLVLMPHVVLLLLVAREDADLLDVCREETLEDGVTEGTGSSGDHECFVFEDGHIVGWIDFFEVILFL